MNRPDKPAATATKNRKDAIQGEGSYDAARRYDKAAREFAESGQVEESAREAAPHNAEEAAELRRAEHEGRSHSKGEDPLLAEPKSKPGQ